MNHSKKIAAAGALFFLISMSLAQGQVLIFDCQSPQTGFEYGLTAELQRQGVAITGVVSVNCCATREYTGELTGGVLRVTLATDGPCDCANQPCQIDLFQGVGVSAVSRVIVVTVENDILLDTSFTATRISGSNTIITKNVVPGQKRIFDLHGRALSGEKKQPSGKQRTRLPRGVYVTNNNDHSTGIMLQP